MISGAVFYLSLVILVIGLAIKVITLYKADPSLSSGVYPKPPQCKRIYLIARDIFTCPGLWEIHPFLWLVVMFFHLALFGIIIGHLHLIGRFPGILEILMTSSAADALVLTLGLLGTGAILVFLFRRMTDPLRYTSHFRDYLLLLLILGAFVSGEVLRINSVSLAFIPESVRNILALQPVSPEILKGSAASWLLPLHLLLVSFLLIYLPFSNLVHMFSSLLTNRLKRV